MSYYDYISAAQKRENAKKSIDKLKEKNPDIEPIIIVGNAIVNTWWGKAWNKNLESYADYRNRISRGRSYVRAGAVLHLKIEKGKIMALVQGSRSKPYDVSISINPLEAKTWKEIKSICNRRIESLEQLATGRFPKELEILFTEKDGIFPSPKEIHFQCSCPDSASLCKHVAATLYGVGARLDMKPMLIFQMRDIAFDELIKRSIEDKLQSMLKNADNDSSRKIDSNKIHDLFGV
ncbi:hypothetical protein GC105_01080 [Alkalibaculum sp. M08DMB]|uniref:SWIM-type domain-containing protein n=1 Tax=Alkalibaculum sporogenes TaxID=2655001 RepID=A0A6A7K4Y1_9FIRM|nr:hypothetical protein [Alkalibaculum sporogenes]MPW24384.1 hypothetical protein [Alkalibaculum sporogenes]